MAKEKNKPVPVRFNVNLLEVLKEEEKIETPQQALNFLANFWENNRPAKEDFTKKFEDVKAPVPATPAPKAKERENKDESTGAPPGLSGIDLSIWKAEQKEKK
jgi:hypothetical protein